MERYKDKYIFRYERDNNGNIYNRDDNYISCRAKGKIYRKSKDVLVFESPRKIRVKNVDAETGEVVFDYSDLILEIWDTPLEREIEFREENLEKLEELFKIRKRQKRNLTDEQRQALRERMAKARGVKVEDIYEGEEYIEEEETDELEDENIE